MLLARARYVCHPEDDEELALIAGEVVRIVESTEPDWLFVEKYEEQGLVPENYVCELQEHPVDVDWAEAVFDNKITDDDELSFQKGDWIMVRRVSSHLLICNDITDFLLVSFYSSSSSLFPLLVVVVVCWLLGLVGCCYPQLNFRSLAQVLSRIGF